jgi:hypothetical protein
MMSVSSIAGGTMLAQAAQVMSTQTAMLKMSADSEQAVVSMLDRASGQAQAPTQAVTPAAAPGKGTQVDMMV